jgi:transposase
VELAGLNGKIADLDKVIARRTREDEVSRRLMTVPGIGLIFATAIAALAPPIETFAKGRDFAARLGLTPLQRSTGGKQKLGATSKMGERTLRRLLIIGSAVVQQASKRGAPKGSWLEQSKEGMAQQSVRRGRKNQMDSSCLEHALMIWFRSASSPYRLAAPSLHQRPDRWQHPTKCRRPLKTACISRGVHR